MLLHQVKESKLPTLKWILEKSKQKPTVSKTELAKSLKVTPKTLRTVINSNNPRIITVMYLCQIYGLNILSVYESFLLEATRKNVPDGYLSPEIVSCEAIIQQQNETIALQNAKIEALEKAIRLLGK